MIQGAKQAVNVRELFESALALPATERVEYLVRECGDPALRQLVERMLAADARAAGVLEPFDELLQHVGDADADAHEPAPGTRVGPFVLLAKLGEGGSSIVFRAEREQDGVRQAVALKLLRRGIYSREERSRFRRERVALSQLRHPAIASLIEGGITEAGVPYIALELVDGETITRWAATRRLDLAGRLRLFVATCRAVEASHRALIVHRDLKPSNVLVTREGEVKLLDFGIAKLLDADDPDDRTNTLHVALTPAYAAPEQFERGPITTSTDVYALGVLLGELVSGVRDERGDRRTPSARVCTGEAADGLPAPSRILRRQLRGDIDNIVTKATASEPERRYVSAGALADDIENHLHGRPVAAHPPSAIYRLRKFALRHRSGVAVAVVVLLAVLAELVVTYREDSLVRRAASRADAMRDFMVSAFAEAEPSTPRAGPPSIAVVVEQAIDKARGDATMDGDVRTELVANLGSVLRVQGQLARAREVLQWNYDRAVHGSGTNAHTTLQAGNELAATMLLAGDYAAARKLIDDLLARTAPDDFKLVASLRLHSATLASKQHETERAVVDAAEGLRLSRAVGSEDALGNALSTYGNVCLSAGNIDGAIRAWEELLAMRTRQFGATHIEVASAHADLSRAYRRAGRLGDAEREIRATLAIDDAVLRRDDWRHALHLNALTMIALKQRDFYAALAAAEESLRIDRIAYGGDDAPEAANDLNSVGMLHAYLEQWPQALGPLRASLEHTSAKFGAEHYETAVTRANYGAALVYTGDVTGGEREIEHAIASLHAAQDPDQEASAWEKLARERLDGGSDAAAIEAIDRIDALVAAIAKPDEYWNGRATTLRAEALLHGGDATGALRLLALADTAVRASRDADPVLRVEIPLLQACAARALGREGDAESFARAGAAALGSLPNPPQRLVALAAPPRFAN